MTAPGRPARPRATNGRQDEVSPLDKRIIEHLQADGRRPFTQIAADLGVSEAAVRARTNRLIERGILQVVGVTDPLKLGFHQMAMIGIRCESDKLIEVAEQLAEMPEVDYVVITAGTYDLLIETVCEDNEALLRLPRRAAARDRRRPRDRDVRLPAAGQADLPVRHALSARSPLTRCARAPETVRRSGSPTRRAAKMPPMRGRTVAHALTASEDAPCAGRAGPDPHRRRGRRQPRVDGDSIARPADGRPARVRWRATPSTRRPMPSGAPPRRRSSAASIGSTDGRRRPDPDLRPRRPDRQLGLPADDDATIVAATGLWPDDPAGDPRPARVRRPVRRGRPRPAPAGHARPGQVRRRGLRGDHGRDAPGRADRRRQPARSSSPSRSSSVGPRSSSRRPITVALAGGGQPRLRPRRSSPGHRRTRWARRPAATVGVNLTALILLAYVAMVIAREQRRTRDAAIRLSTVDPLTGLFNRTFFFAAIEREIARSARSGRGFCLLMMDLDELKAINDRLGHFHGDRVLRGVGEVIAVRRPPDRHRGPLRRRRVRRPPARDRSDRRLRPGREDPARRPRDGGRPAGRQPAAVALDRASSAIPTTAGQRDELMISADGAMYASKRAGKDRVTGVPMPLERTRAVLGRRPV